MATFPAFEVRPDGRSLVSVRVRGPLSVTEQKVEGRLVYDLGGVAASEKVNRLPLLTQHFPTPVSSVALQNTASGGTQLVIELREQTKATYAVTQEPGGYSMLTVSVPKSEKYAKESVFTLDDDSDASSEGGAGDANDQLDDETAEDRGTESAREQERRRKRSKRQPKPYVMRPLTLPRATLATDLSLAIAGSSQDTASQAYFLASGIRIGVADFFEIEATPHSFRLSPQAAYAFPSLGFTLGYTGNTFEIAGRARYFIPIDSENLINNPDLGLASFGVPMAIHLSSWGRIDTGVFVAVQPGFSSGNVDGSGKVVFSTEPRVGLFEFQPSPFMLDSGIPLKFLFNITEAFWVGVHHGLTIGDFNDAGDTLALPLGFELGITAANDYNPVADLGVRLDFPAFISPAANDILREDLYQLGLWFRWFNHL